MHRKPILDLLDAYEGLHPEEGACVGRVRALVQEHPDCFERSCLPGHITASSWIVSRDHTRFLLTHHRKLDRWLQLGGHADGETLVHEVALREAREESGLSAFELIRTRGRILPVDVDVHAIPERPGEPSHEHHDLRFLLVAQSDEPVRVSEESHDVRWFPLHELDRVVGEASILRMAAKASALLAALPRR